MSLRAEAAAVVALSLALTWLLASAVSRGQGIYPFLAGIVALGLAMSAHAQGHRTVLYRFLYVQLLAALMVVGLETITILWPGTLKGQVANVAYTGYHWQKGGIYTLDPHRGPVLRPSFTRAMYWNGHTWRHQTNADGYRGPAREHAEIVFLGDSMVYGHGADESDTVSERLAAQLGAGAVNLGQQGTCLLQSMQTMRMHAPRLRPRVVFACLHYNDIEEALRYYDRDELRLFLASPPGTPRDLVARAEYRPEPWWNLRQLFAQKVALPLRIAGISGALARLWRGTERGAIDGHPRDPFVPTAEEQEAAVPALSEGASPDERLAWQAEQRAALETKIQSTALGARLVLFDLGYPEAHTRAVEALANRLGVTYSPAGRVALARSRAGEPIYLANDGHWSGSGAAAVARELARAVSTR